MLQSDFVTLMMTSIKKFRGLGLTDEQITTALELTAHEVETYLK
jgi:hypothetical protein